MVLYVPVENLQGRDFNPIEEVGAFRTLQGLGFPPELQELVSRDTITPAHAEALARLAIARACVRRN